MNKLIRYYNQNRKQVWRIIVIITFALSLLYALNYYSKKQNEKEVQQAIVTAKKSQTVIEENNNNNISSSNSSSATKTSTVNPKKETIEKFISYCNNQELENAYNMLTDNCKNEMFENIDKFRSIYYDTTFQNMKKEETIEKWAGNTYLVKLAENALLKGKTATTKEEQKIDYITVVQDGENKYKLNINSYIGYKELSKSKTSDNVTIDVIGKHMYMEYEKYVVIVSNKSNERVQLDSLYNVEKLYIEDSNGVKYPSYTSELEGGLLNIASGHAKQINIKFFNAYVSDRVIKRLVFSDYKKGDDNTSFSIEL